VRVWEGEGEGEGGGGGWRCKMQCVDAFDFSFLS
jgi:hypothetical protein